MGAQTSGTGNAVSSGGDGDMSYSTPEEEENWMKKGLLSHIFATRD